MPLRHAATATEPAHRDVASPPPSVLHWTLPDPMRVAHDDAHLRRASDEVSARPGVTGGGVPPAASPKSHKKRWHNLLAGGLAGAVARTATAPLDRLKVLMQEGRLLKFEQHLHHPSLHVVADSHKRRLPLRKVVAHVYYESGIGGFWRGNGINCFKAGPELALVFYLRQAIGDASVVCGNFLLALGALPGTATAGDAHDGQWRRRGRVSGPLHGEPHGNDEHHRDPHVALAPVSGGEHSLSRWGFFQGPFGVLKHLREASHHHQGLPRKAPLGVGSQDEKEGPSHQLFGSSSFDCSAEASHLRGAPRSPRHEGDDRHLVQQAPSWSQAAQRLVSDFITSATAGAVAQTIVYPLEILKTRIAVAQRGEYAGLVDCVQRMYLTGGWREFYKGLGANMLGIVPFRGLEIGLFFSIKRTWEDRKARRWRSEGEQQHRDRLDVGRAVTANSNDRGVAGDETNSVESAAANGGDVSPGPLQLAHSDDSAAVAHHSTRPPYSHPQGTGGDGGPSDVPLTLAMAEVAAAGAVASVVAQTVTYPLNIVRTRLQTQGVNGRPMLYDGTFHCLRTVLATEGILGLFHGLTANYLKAVPASVITFVVVSKVNKTLEDAHV